MPPRLRTCLGVALVFSAGTAAAAPRALPSLSLVDARGAVVADSALTQSSNWVLLVVDADKPLTASVLPRLQRKDGDWAGKVVVVAVGAPSAFARMVAHNAKLSGVRWCRDTTGRLLERLELSGTPVLLGVRPDNVIAWQMATIPEMPEKAQAVVTGWTARPGPEQ